jgi:hypothetical protein
VILERTREKKRIKEGAGEEVEKWVKKREEEFAKNEYDRISRSVS